MSEPSVLVVGTGHAAFQLAAALRLGGFEGRVTLVGEEPGLPYQRPPLSKKYLKGEEGSEAVELRRASFYETNRIEVIDRTRIARIDRAGRRALTVSGTPLAYDRLVLATGVRNRRPPIPGLELDGVVGLRTREESEALRHRLLAARRLIVIGAGFIGLEVAATARLLGLEVVVMETADRVMARSVTSYLSSYFENAHRQAGVDLRLSQSVTAVHGSGGHFSAIETADGDRVEGDLLLVATGVAPNDELARDCGLEVDNGIAVDRRLATSDPAIFAIGDCVSFPSRWAGGRCRLESVQNAVDQAKCLAKGLTSAPEDYDAVPWFWSDQYKLKLQIAGLAAAADTTVPTRDPDSGRFSVCCFREGRLIGVESVSLPADHLAARKLLADASALTPDAAAEPGFTLKDFATAAA